MMILAGDIGGTKTLLALFDSEGERPLLIDERTFPSSRYADIEEVIAEFLSGREVSLQGACFGVAGPVLNGRCEATNLSWIVDANQIARRFRIASVTLLNDLEATAFGTLALTEKECQALNPGAKEARGNRAVIAAGTGLGEAILFWDGSRYRPAATEGGHSDFAPRNRLEIELLEYLLSKYSRVSYERVLSGPGLWNIYRFLKETGKGEEPAWLSERLTTEDPSAAIAESALARRVPLCIEALDLFASIYGAEAGNLALKTLATGGVYIGGGIAPKILAKLTDGAFVKAFTDKGRFSSLMKRIPVQVILSDKAALLGAARYGLLWSGRES